MLKERIVSFQKSFEDFTSGKEIVKPHREIFTDAFFLTFHITSNLTRNDIHFIQNIKLNMSMKNSVQNKVRRRNVLCLIFQYHDSTDTFYQSFDRQHIHYTLIQKPVSE
jgi:hypothetical protein